jgi:hypothetical protein
MGESDYRQEQEPFQGRLLQPRVLGFGLLQDGDVGIGIEQRLTEPSPRTSV